VPGHGAKLDRRQEQAVAALLTEGSVEDAARKARVAYSTLRGWLQQPEFQAAYRAARAELLERTIAKLLRTCGRAVERLDANLGAESVQGSNRAAALVLAMTMKGLEALDLRAEVDELKRRLDELQKGSGGHDGTPGVGETSDGNPETDATDGPDPEPDAARDGPQ
jgi:hypothetical protein